MTKAPRTLSLKGSWSFLLWLGPNLVPVYEINRILGALSSERLGCLAVFELHVTMFRQDKFVKLKKLKNNIAIIILLLSNLKQKH
ncbi:hypothetical protein EQG49_05655 [Periweissella cryptocerci]|uniref:Uncharacterized protein n=1 Tax=Periweissella cryptocerci TaxID=2506420 RepID=A0A4P6YTG6_9LACO|nr:hypothetical protein [Periweissella cryptocerci]QBO35980.1 hypothetical protein EQG49_05655 [Periweissella cryptocerci]